MGIAAHEQWNFKACLGNQNLAGRFGIGNCRHFLPAQHSSSNERLEVSNTWSLWIPAIHFANKPRRQHRAVSPSAASFQSSVPQSGVALAYDGAARSGLPVPLIPIGQTGLPTEQGNATTLGDTTLTHASYENESATFVTAQVASELSF